MAIFRKIHTTFWSDPFISELEENQKLFYIYLLTNERTKQCGIYEITKKQIAFDLGYSMDTVSILLVYFIKKGKIRYNPNTCELALGNWLKYNSSTSPKVLKCIESEFLEVKDRVLIEYVKSMDTLSQQEQEQEEEKEKEEDFSFPDIPDSIIVKGENESYRKLSDDQQKDVDVIIEILIKDFALNINSPMVRGNITGFARHIITAGMKADFEKQYTSYRKLVKNKEQLPFNINRFIGTQNRDYLDGEWFKNDWKQKLKKVKI